MTEQRNEIFTKGHYTRFAKSPLAYKQYTPDDPVTNSLYDINFACDSRLHKQNKASLLIDSKTRPPNTEPNKYVQHLKKEYKDVVSIELQRVDIPNSDYNVNEYNNTFYFQDAASQVSGCTYHTMIFPVGNYKVDEEDCNVVYSLKCLLEQGLNSTNPDNQYRVTIDKNSMKITIEQTTGSGVFNILFTYPQRDQCHIPLNNNMAQLLGFKLDNKMGNTTYTGEYVYDLYPTKYLILRVQGWERIDSPHDPAQNAFVILPFNKKAHNFNLADNLDSVDEEEFKIHFNPPLGTLDRINLEFVDENGHPYNFRGRNYYMVFEITSLSRHSNY